MFRLAGQKPSVDKLVYIPKPGESREYEHPVLLPGMEGFDGPITLEPIKPYNPSEDESEFIQLAEEDVIASRSGLVGTQPQDERFIFVPKKTDPRLSEFEPFDIVRGEGGAPGDPYKGDGMPPYWPRPTPTPRPTPPAPQARMAGLSEAIAAIVKALS